MSIDSPHLSLSMQHMTPEKGANCNLLTRSSKIVSGLLNSLGVILTAGCMNCGFFCVVLLPHGSKHLPHVGLPGPVLQTKQLPRSQ